MIQQGWKKILEVLLENLGTLLDTQAGKIIATAAVSMIPVVELRGGIPFGVLLDLQPVEAYLAAVMGNMVPVPLIIVYIRRVFLWTRRQFPKLGGLVDALERKAHLKGRMVLKYRYLGLFIFVALPLPGTGAWTGALAAAFLNMRLRNAAPSIFMGLLTAGLIVTLLVTGVLQLPL